MKYYQTPLESWISKFYTRLRILDPDDLTEENICFLLSIYLYRRPQPSHAFEQGRFRSITIDNRLAEPEQREQFYHELCHILRHAGKQTVMPLAFRELQEWDANNFVRYAAIPAHMLWQLNFEDSNLIADMARRFGVPERLCEDRLVRIKERMLKKQVDL